MKAYPFSHKHPTTGLTSSSEGMDLRDVFAVASLPIVSSGGKFWQEMAVDAYKLADEMLRVRSKQDE